MARRSSSTATRTAGRAPASSGTTSQVLTIDNYERAAAALLDVLAAREDVRADRIVVYGQGFGSYRATRIAAADRRVRAVARTGASIRTTCSNATRRATSSCSPT